MAIGKKTGGRTKGTKNKRTPEAIALLESLGVDGLEGMAKIAIGDVPCLTCLGKGRAKYSIAEKLGPYRDEELGQERICLTCQGTGRHPVEMETRAAMFKEVAQYAYPKKKAIEVSASHGLTVNILKGIIDPNG